MFVGAILKALSVSAQAYAPTGSNHLAAHFPCAGRAQRHVRKIRVLDRVFRDIAYADPVSQVFSRSCNCFFFGKGHFRLGAQLATYWLTLQTTLTLQTSR